MVAIQVRFNPFPGLRPFKADEAHLFFGREGQADELLRRLMRNRLLAVVGTSGSGKSSLVRAGLLPYLHSGFMVKAGSSWRVAMFRPGDNPIGNLAKALNNPKAFGTESEDAISQIIAETTLRRGALGLVEVVQQAQMPSSENLLVVVDQFEELFRFKQNAPNQNSGDEAAAFVKLLLEATRKKVVPIYVVITMRSDFLGDCAQFRDLPEALNDSQYLVPRMTRDQRRIAIEGPVAVGGSKMAPRLVNRLLNDVGDNPDQLPILQHVLMRTWDYWVNNHEDRELIDLRHYEAVGTMAKALSQHADEIYQGLPNSNCQKIAEKLFKCLTEKTTDGRSIRRPTKLQEVCAVAQAKEAEVIDIVEKFRTPSCSFLMPPVGTKLDGDCVLDISHESLMRSWQKLKEWVEEENQLVQIYRRLVDASVLYQKGESGLWRDPELTIALKWLEKNQPNAAWAKRYNSAFEQVMNFLEESTVARNLAIAHQKKIQGQKEAIRRQRLILVGVGIGFIITTFLGILVFIEYRRSQKNEIEALTASSKAQLVLNRGFDALMESLKAGRKLKQRFMAEDNTSQQVVTVLQQVISEVNEFNRLESHKDKIWNVSFSPDGKTLATASSDNTVKLWSLDGKELKTLKGHTNAVTGVSFSPDGKTLATASSDKTIKLWDISTGKQIKTLTGHQDAVNNVSFSPDGSTLATASSDKTIKLWDISTSKEIKTLTGHQDVVTDVSFSPDSSTLATASSDGKVKLWNKDGKLLKFFEAHSNSVNDMNFSPDGKTLATASLDNTVKLWRLDGKLIGTLKGHSDAVNSVSFSPNFNNKFDKFILTASQDKTIKLWREDGTVVKTFEGHSDAVNHVSFSPDAKRFATASSDRTVKLWKLNQNFFTSLLGHTDEVTSVSFSPDGKMLATASSDNTIKLWDAYTGKQIKTLRGHIGAVTSVSFSPDGKMLATASSDNTIKLWDAYTGKQIKTLTGYTDAVTRVSFSPDGKTLATASLDNNIRLWNVYTGKTLATLKEHEDSVTSVSFSPDGKLLATANDDKTLKLWDISTGKEIKTLTGNQDLVTGVSFSPDGKTLATASLDNTVKLWSTDGTLKTTLTGSQDAFSSVSFSPNGKTLATASQDNTVKLWSTEGKLLTTLKGHTNAVTSVSFSPDGKTLASASADKTIILQNLQNVNNPNMKPLINPSLDDLLERGCDWVGDYLKNNPNVSERKKALCD